MEKVIYDVLKKLNDYSYESYVVGGYVRDYLLNKVSLDVDIATIARPKEVLELFKEYNPVSLDYGNVTFTIDDYDFEITTFRKDIKYINNRKPEKIVYIDSLEEDLKRRDFTINCICLDLNDNIIDIYDGRLDLKRKVIKTVGTADERIEEDALRILRAIRFACILKFRLDNELKKAIIKHKDLLRNLSYERKREELTKIFTSKNKKYGVKLIQELGLEEALELKNLKYVFHTNDPIGMWSVITDSDYAFTKYEKEIMEKVTDLLDKNLYNKYIQYKYGSYPLTIASDLRGKNTKKIMISYDNLPIKDRKELKITADEICESLGRDPGSFLKTIFEDLERLVLYGKLENSKEAIENYVRQSY